MKFIRWSSARRSLAWPPTSELLLTGALGTLLLAALAPLTGSFWLYLAFHPVCHQLPERALWIAGAPMALCARCTAIAAGAAVALIAGVAPRRRLFFAALLLAAADFASEWLGLRPAWTAGRVLTGLFVGFTSAPLVSWSAAACCRLQATEACFGRKQACATKAAASCRTPRLTFL